MSISQLPLSYCTNVHPGRTVAEVLDGLSQYTRPAREQFGETLAAGLWLAAPVAEELAASPDQVNSLQTHLREWGLVSYTLNAFPYGDFHSERVKEQVYLPDWTTDSRREYTLRCARLLAQLMPVGVEGSLSTVPLGFKSLSTDADFLDRSIEQLLRLAAALDELHDETGQVLRLAIEPEPLCVLETTPETLAFFDRLFAAAEKAGQLDLVRRHIGVCYDVCHQAVEFEDVTTSIQSLEQADIRINKVHITCALRLERPAENSQARQELAGFAEPRYLHQTFARSKTGTTCSLLDLSSPFCADPPAEFLSADEWRIHFHVPVHRESVGSLGTTRDDLKQALAAVAKLPYAPHLEVETYTWGVLPGGKQMPLEEGLFKELDSTRELLRTISAAVAT